MSPSALGIAANSRSFSVLSVISPLGFGGSDEAVHDRMPIEMTPAGNGSPGGVISALEDLIRRYLDALALSLNPVATAVCLISGGLTISLRRAA
jgi:hypothetical protein